jgi:hypothetical protein
MIRPEEVKLTSDKRNERLAAIEAQFDDAIRKAEASGEWPAIVPNWRDGATDEEVSSVIDKYAAAGWKFGHAYSTRAVILRPVTNQENL